MAKTSTEQKAQADMEAVYIDTLLETPKSVILDGKAFNFYPLTLGTMHRQAQIVKAVGINEVLLKSDPTFELLRIATQKPEETSELLAMRACKGYKEIFGEKMDENLAFFRTLEPKEKTILLQLIVDKTDMDTLLHYLHIDRELNALRSARAAKKKNRNTLSFGGVSLYGSMISPACEKYGWTYEYVLWEISYSNLRLLLADSTKEVYLTDKERRNAVILPHGNNIKKAEGMTAEQIREMFYK